MRAGPPQESGGPPPANPPRRSMSKEDNIEVTGTVLEKFPSGKFSVQIDHDRVVLAHLFHSVAELQQAIREYIDEHNRKPKPYLGTAKARDILEKVKRAWTKLRAGGFVPKS